MQRFQCLYEAQRQSLLALKQLRRDGQRLNVSLRVLRPARLLSYCSSQVYPEHDFQQKPSDLQLFSLYVGRK